MYEKELAQKKSPAYEMAAMVFDQFNDQEQVSIVKEFLQLLVDKRQERYESLIDESRRLEARAKDIAVGNQVLVQ